MTTLREAVYAAARQYLERLILETNGNVSKAADVAGMNRSHFYRVLKRHGLAYMNDRMVLLSKR